MKIDQQIKDYGIKHNVPITLDDTLCFLCELINKNNFKTVLEIGTAIGYGCITIAQNTNVTKIDSVEIDPERFNLAKENVKQHNLENVISLYNTDAMKFLKQCKSKYQFIYLDGPKGQYANYLPYLINLLEVGGIIVADNLYFHGMVTGKIPVTKGCRAMIKGLKQYIEEITTNKNLSSTIKDVGDGIGITKRLK